MLLKKIEISGFKSFAKKSVLDFKTPITAIVGPNGSGKSNVAEAFSFVLGEQSIKSLRGKKGEDMIFNGSKTNSRSNRASVKVFFDNTSKFLDIEYDEVVIERVVHRDSSNQYLINGTQVRLKDVIELLAKANIGSSGHHIISQGEADRILNVNPKERKLLIEDALGLKIYQIKRKESERKLERTEENIKQVGSLRKEIKPHLNFLRKQARKIEKTLEMRVELMVIYKEYLRRESGYLEEKKRYIKEEGKEPKERIVILEKELEKVQKITGQQEEGKVKELRESEEEIRKIRGEKDKVSFNLGRLEGELSSREKILERGERRQKERTISVSEVQKVVDEVDKEIDSAEKDPTKIKTVLSEIKRLIKSLVNRGDSTSLSDLKNDKQGIGDLKVKISRGKNEVDKLEEREEELNKKVKKLREEIDKGRESQMGAEKQTFQIMSEQQNLKIKLNELKNLNERIEREEGNFKREITEAASLLGREILKYEDLSLKDNEGIYITSEDMAEEDRYKQEDRKRKIEKIKIRLEDAGGASGEEILREFEEINERDQFLEKEINDLEETAKSLKDLVKELEEKLEVEFKKGIGKINKEFQEFFSLMFGGGSASLNIVKTKEDEEIISDGVDISVSLPRKKIKGLMVLSGGERALTSIALLFAMSQVQPPPFIVLDETDAALDEANSKKYGDMVKSLSEHSQLILITHNRETMSRAGVLYGVTMGADGISKLLSVDLEEAVEVAK